MAFEWTGDTDVVVVGGGGCGLAAALAARQEDVEVVLLEESDRLGGTTSLSVGSIPAAWTRLQRDHGIEDSPELMAEDIFNQAGRQGRYELTRRLADRSNDLVEWFTDNLAVPLELIADYKHVGHTRNRLHAPPGRSGAVLISHLSRVAEQRGIYLVLHSPVARLISDNGDVLGVETATNGRPEFLKAKKVILANNGFGANREMLVDHCPGIAGAAYVGVRNSRGDGIRWGQDLGARTAAMGAYLAYAAISPTGGLVSWTVVEKGGVVLNLEGRRFADESVGYSGMGGPLQAQPQSAGWIVCDQRIHDEVARFEPVYVQLDEVRAVKGGFATTLDLARGIDLSPKTVEDTLTAYEDAATGGRDPFGRTEFGLAPLRPPYRAIFIEAGLLQTQGGLDIDLDARPLRADGSVVGNLYAGGGVAAGISGVQGGGGYSSGNGLLTAFGWGMIAGDHAGRSVRGKVSA